jgi:hypothetical protein
VKRRTAECAISIFNDVIQQEAQCRSSKVLELRGGAKLAKAMNAWVKENHASRRE